MIPSLIGRLFEELPLRRKREFFAVVVLMVVAAGLELAGVGAIFAFVRMASEAEIIYTNQWLNSAYGWSGLDEPRYFLAAAGACVLVLFLTKNTFVIFVRRYQCRFMLGTHYDLSLRLLSGYLTMPYARLAASDASGLGHRVLVEVDRAINGALAGAMNVLSEVLVVLAIAALLFWNEPGLTTLAVVVVAVAYLLVYRFVRKTHERLGDVVNEANIARYETVEQVLDGAKEIRAGSIEGFFWNRFARPAGRFRDAVIKQQVLNEVPRIVIESTAFGGLVVLVVLALVSDNQLSTLIPTLVLLAAGAYRVMPSLNRILTGIAQIRFSRMAVGNVVGDLRQLRQLDKSLAGIKRMGIEHELEFRNVAYRYPGAEKPAVLDVSFKVAKGEHVALVGPTGSGKTTVVDLLLGILEPTGGEITVDGQRLEGVRKVAWSKTIGYVAQSPFLLDDTITRNIAFGVDEQDIDLQKVKDVAVLAHIDEFIEGDTTDGYQTRIGKHGIRLSGGQRQRLALARALYRDPTILVLDEATSALDGETETAIQGTIEGLAKKLTIVVIAHRLSTIRQCTRIIVLHGGRVVGQGTFDELEANQDVFRRMVDAANRKPGSDYLSAGKPADAVSNR